MSLTYPILYIIHFFTQTFLFIKHLFDRITAFVKSIWKSRELSQPPTPQPKSPPPPQPPSKSPVRELRARKPHSQPSAREFKIRNLDGSKEVFRTH
ncbi:uncharacterized protein BDZ99DRAFT_262297 [Mytilinidion resinicola]|uniref:Uncharacterized protein n=1 Tax=Mytilinidion resinicola TaxID=574789 RepID=A0A6A6YTK7_9PEZI|nr:uncharacterized protein BDZ99DRAFT_262297 [Mytilinidion resinicola]KAF2812140.1 hypothetical protein BDZ99DRAFT_262297 [Mytilinidion resinicola]